MKKMLREAEQEYLRNFCNNIKDEPKKFWRFVNYKRKEREYVSSLKHEGATFTEDHQKAKILNEQFKSVFLNIKHNNVQGLDDGHAPLHNKLTDIVLTEINVYKELIKLDITKATGPDGISAQMLKMGAGLLTKPLTRLFNMSLKTGNVPQGWKIANVTPIYKKGSKSDPKNYRPVSLTSIVSKVLEKVVRSQLAAHLKEHSILTENQHGFRNNRSCETQLLQSTHSWAESLDKNIPVDIIYLDLSRAFDVVSHDLLLVKLKKVGICGNILRWIKSFLTNRKQRVKVGDVLSDWCAVTSGVPQGTILGPVMFLVYINDICKDINSFCKLYADDCVLYRPIRSYQDNLFLQ